MKKVDAIGMAACSLILGILIGIFLEREIVEHKLRDLTEIVLELPPVGEKVVLEQHNTTQTWGWSNWSAEQGMFTISLYRGMDLEAATETLAHEWAHLLTWDNARGQGHGPAWGRAYAKCYRTIVEGK